METAEQREERLKIMRERLIKRRAIETAEQREERLQSLRDRQRDRVSRLRINQTERIDMETDNEERSSLSHRFPQLQHSEVMKKFRTHLDSLEINKCATCLEAFLA